jgi:tRNA(fMet)-specific endonuclease VapC
VSFLLDTDICSAFMKNQRLVTNRFFQYGGRLYISAVTLGELFTWACRANAPASRLPDVEALLNEVAVLDVSPAVARTFGEVRARLFDAGTPAPEMDLLIAATAIVHNSTLVTHNTKDYAAIPAMNLADWLVP